MPRGNKKCPTCQADNGPRAFSCKACKAPFVLRGVLTSQEKIAEVEARKNPIVKNEDGEFEEEILESLDYFDVVKPTHIELRNQGSKVHCWESRDKKYRLRWSREFMGVSIEHLHGRPYCLLRNGLDKGSRPTLSLVHRFKSMQGALKGYVKILNGIPLGKPKEDIKVKNKKRLKRQLKKINKES